MSVFICRHTREPFVSVVHMEIGVGIGVCI